MVDSAAARERKDDPHNDHGDHGSQRGTEQPAKAEPARECAERVPANKVDGDVKQDNQQAGEDADQQGQKEKALCLRKADLAQSRL